MVRHPVGAVAGLLAAGLLIRLVLSATTGGVEWDLESYSIVSTALSDAPLSVYDDVNADTYRWPYPPLYFLWILTAQQIADVSGVGFYVVMRLAPISADLALAWIVQWWLGVRGASTRTRVLSAACVALGPIFVAVSSYHGQLDSVAILPAVVAVIAWQWPGLARRALIAGVLIGVGAALKTVPGLLLLALLPTARSVREAVVLTVSALAVPLVVFAPFLATDAAAVVEALRYRGVPGLGGLSLAVQPSLGAGWLGGEPAALSAVSAALRDYGTVLTLGALAVVAVAMIRRRAAAVGAAVIVCLTLYVFGGNFFLQYVVWGMPFLLLAGRWKLAAAAQLLLAPAALVSYADIDDRTAIELAYVAPVLAFLALCVAALALDLRKLVRPAEARPALSDR